MNLKKLKPVAKIRTWLDSVWVHKTLLLKQCNYELMIFVMILLFENFIDSLTNLNGKNPALPIIVKKQHTTHEPLGLCDSVTRGGTCR